MCGREDDDFVFFDVPFDAPGRFDMGWFFDAVDFVVDFAVDFEVDFEVEGAFQLLECEGALSLLAECGVARLAGVRAARFFIDLTGGG